MNGTPRINLDRLGAEVWRIHPPMPSWAWAAKNINYQRAPNYDTPYQGPFDPELMPFWKEPLEKSRDPAIREIVIRKPARAGFSENFILTDSRYGIAREPEPTLYISGKMELAKGFFDRRVCRGMDLSEETRRQYRRAKVLNTQGEIQFPDMDFRCTWISSDTAVKQDGWARIYCDEVDIWSELQADQVRKRADAYPFHHIIWGSSLDPTRRGDPNESPIIKLYDESNQCKWHMPDPAGGTFVWNFAGIKWPDDCKGPETGEWNEKRVRAEAYYETPNGTRIENSERMAYTRKGKWIGKDTNNTRVGYWITAPMIPFKACDFGELAWRFLSAKHRINLKASRAERGRNTLRTYFAEYWAEAHRDEEQETTESALEHCESDYEIGFPNVLNEWISGNYATGDVQKAHLWWLTRLWAMKKKSDLVESQLTDYGTAASFMDFDELIAQYEPALVGIDISYPLRQSEVADYCAEYTADDPRESRVIALRGSDSLKATSLTWTVRDALEGRASGGSVTPFLELTWSVDVFRTWLTDTITEGETWKLPKKWANAKQRAQYVKQVTSTKKVDGGWLEPKDGQDHLYDCEVMQFVLARHDGLL